MRPLTEWNGVGNLQSPDSMAFPMSDVQPDTLTFAFAA